MGNAAARRPAAAGPAQNRARQGGATRWPVERTLAWFHQNRRLRRRYEQRADIHLAFLLAAFIKVRTNVILTGYCKGRLHHIELACKPAPLGE
jgi:uncharacterized membrane protein